MLILTRHLYITARQLYAVIYLQIHTYGYKYIQHNYTCGACNTSTHIHKYLYLSFAYSSIQIVPYSSALYFYIKHIYIYICMYAYVCCCCCIAIISFDADACCKLIYLTVRRCAFAIFV